MKKHQRAIKKIKIAVSKLQLDLSEQTILTEVGSNEYVYIPIIAAIAGAKKVFAWTRDTQYGLAQDIIKECQFILTQLDLLNKVDFYVGEFNQTHIEQADIITNSGFLRPLDETKLKFSKKGVVIPLMYEKWELRETDVDSVYCKTRNIKLAGTWENHPDLMVFEHVGPLAIKMALNSGFEVYRNKIIVWSNDHFGEVAENAFNKFGATKVVRTTDEKTLLENADADFIFLCDYDELRNYSNNEVFDVNELLKRNKEIGLVHLYGKLDYLKLSESICLVYPKFDGKESIMTHTLSYVGMNPIIDLQVAGFKVAQLMKEGGESDILQHV